MTESLYKITCLCGTMSFIEPKYHIEPRLDLRGRVKDWSIKCDTGINILGFETKLAARTAAHTAGIKLSQ